MTKGRKGFRGVQGALAAWLVLTLASSGSGTPQSSSLVGYWKLDETAVGTATDSSGYGNDGTHINNPAPDPGDVAVPGGGGGSWAFANPGSLLLDATLGQQYVEVANSASLSVGNTFTLAAWVKPTADTGTVPPDAIVAQKCIIEHWTSGTSGFDGINLRLSWTNTGNNMPVFTIGDGVNGNVQIDAGAQLTVGQWAHLAATYDGTTMSLYVNGGLAKTGPCSYVPTTTNLWHIGKDYGSNVFTGNLDEVRIYNAVLAAQDILDLYNGIDVGGSSAGGGGGGGGSLPPAVPLDREGEECGCGTVSAVEGLFAPWTAALAALALVFLRRRR